MAAIFPRWMNLVPTIAVVSTPAAVAAVAGALWYWASPAYTDAGYQPRQPVAFSHRVCAGRSALDCRYCHDTVEFAAHAAIPPTGTCMNCHAVIGRTSALLAPVRESHESGTGIAWVRVHVLPDFARFDHGMHSTAGVGCVDCHGRVDEMDVVRQHEALDMAWCLDCHRAPRARLRPLDRVTDMTWSGTYEPETDPARTRDVDPPVHCSGCHQ
jgi:hypothetical protein